MSTSDKPKVGLYENSPELDELRTVMLVSSEVVRRPTLRGFANKLYYRLLFIRLGPLMTNDR